MSLVSQVYRRYVRLLQNWPLDATKEGRDYAKHLRDQFAAEFKEGEFSKINNLEASVAKLEALERIAGNKHYEESTVKPKITASGLTSEECQLLISNEAMSEMKAISEKSIIEKLMLRLEEIKYSKFAKKQQETK